MDWGGPVPHEDMITVPETHNLLNRADMEELERIVAPLQPSVIELYSLYHKTLLVH